jgi:hypothetical protein
VAGLEDESMTVVPGPEDRSRMRPCNEESE